jgi:L-glutamine-phosphate cytidylyltransferase
MKAIILNAGQSTRLAGLTQDKPKCLVEVGNDTILGLQLNALSSVGIDKVMIVTGYKSEKIEDFIQGFRIVPRIRVKTVFNREYEFTDNAYSLSLALDNPPRDSIILDGDVVFHPSVLRWIVDSPNTLVVEKETKPTEEDCKVEASGDGYARGIGKDKSGFVYASMANLDSHILSEMKNETKRNREWYSEPLDRALKRNPKTVRVLAVDPYLRCEIDTVGDLVWAENLISMWR